MFFLLETWPEIIGESETCPWGSEVDGFVSELKFSCTWAPF